jgi:hypothetical protein
MSAAEDARRVFINIQEINVVDFSMHHGYISPTRLTDYQPAVAALDDRQNILVAQNDHCGAVDALPTVEPPPTEAAAPVADHPVEATAPVQTVVADVPASDHPLEAVVPLQVGSDYTLLQNVHAAAVTMFDTFSYEELLPNESFGANNNNDAPQLKATKRCKRTRNAVDPPVPLVYTRRACVGKKMMRYGYDD